MADVTSDLNRQQLKDSPFLGHEAKSRMIKSARASCISQICQISVYYYDITLSNREAVKTHLDTEISSDGAGGRVSRVGGSQHHTTSLDSVEALPHHRNHGAARSKTHY